MNRYSARDFIQGLVDTGSFQPWDTGTRHHSPVSGSDPGTTAADNTLITGSARIAGQQVGLVVGDFGVRGGSIGVAEADRFTGAIRRATQERLPVLAAPASGGTRMQEGTPAFLRMVPMSSAVLEHKRAGLPYLVYLRQPTTGGVMASWGSLGHLTFAEPGALLGFLGPRATEAITGEAIPQFVQRAENLFAHGLLDGVLDIHALRKTLSGILSALTAVVPTSSPAGASPIETPRDIRDPWMVVESSRLPDRPGARELLACATHVTELTLAGRGGATHPLLVALARIADRPCVVLAQDRASQRDGALLGPEDLRVGRRAIRLADELRLPLVTVVDTPGAALSREAEEGGLAQEIAGCIADLLDLSSPSVSVLMGQGGGGAALALLPADRVIAGEGAWLAPLPPEGASAILHRTPQHAPALARSQVITATDLFRQGYVDRLVAETPGPGGAGWEHAVIAAVGEELAQLSERGGPGSGRADRFRTAEPLVPANA